MTNSFYHYYAVLTGRAVPHTTAKVRYVDTTTHAGLCALGPLLAKRNKEMFCLNDGSIPEVDLAVRTATMTEFLDRYYPLPAIPAPDQDRAIALPDREHPHLPVGRRD